MPLRLAWTPSPNPNVAQRFRDMTSAFEARDVLWHEARVSTDIEALRADLVIVGDPAQAKVWRSPTFGWVEGARLPFFRDPRHQIALMSWDGLLGTSQAMVHLGDAFAAGWSRPAVSAIFSPSPALRTAPAWQLGPVLCRASPGDDWAGSVQLKLNQVERLADTAAGKPEGGVLIDVPDFGSVCEETMSLAALDAAAEGRLLIAPDLSINRQVFGEGFVPYEVSPSADQTARAISQALLSIQQDPDAAARRVALLQETYARTSGPGAMVQRLIDLAQRFDALRSARAEGLGEPSIDVIVRAGGRPLQVVERALQSVDEQGAGRFRVILVRYRELDLTPLVERDWRRIDRIEIIDLAGGSRAQTLCAGLKAVASPWFACLDDDDFWAPDHIETLLVNARHLSPDLALAYSGLVEADDRAPDGQEARRVSMLQRGAGNLLDVMGVFGLHCFLAARPLLEGINLDGWALTTAEDTALIGQLLAKADVAYSYRPTAFISVGGDDRSNFLKDPRRPENVVEAFLRIGPGMEVIEQKSPRPALRALDRITDALAEAARARAVELAAASKGEILVIGDGLLSSPLHQRRDVEAKPLLLSEMTLETRGRSRFVRGSSERIIELLADPAAWAEAAGMRLSRFDLYEGPQWIVVELGPTAAPLGVGLLTGDGRDYLRRTEAPVSDRPVEIWLSVQDPSAVSRLVFQNWDQPAQIATQLRAVHVVRQA